MSKRIKKYFKIAFLVLIVGSYLCLVRFNGGTFESGTDNIVDFIRLSYNEFLDYTLFGELYYNFFALYFGDSFLSNFVFSIFVFFIGIDLLGILYDVLMFIPNVVGKLLNNISKGGVKDE